MSDMVKDRVECALARQFGALLFFAMQREGMAYADIAAKLSVDPKVVRRKMLGMVDGKDTNTAIIGVIAAALGCYFKVDLEPIEAAVRRAAEREG